MDIKTPAAGCRLGAESGEADAKARRSIAPAVPATRSRETAPTLPLDVDARLDEALQMTFPASDPISVSAHRTTPG
jgi:hypothetical protein